MTKTMTKTMTAVTYRHYREQTIILLEGCRSLTAHGRLIMQPTETEELDLNIDKKSKITRYVVSSAMVANALAAPVAVFAADEARSPDALQAAVNELMEKAIMVGDDKGQLNLEGKLTRAQVAAILARSLNLNATLAPVSDFKDVSKDHWGLKYISVMDRLGVMTGSDGSFRPNAVLTREELAVILVRITQTSIVGKGGGLAVSDASEISSWAKPYVQAALEADLLSAPGGRFAPKSQVDRKEVALVTSAFINGDNFEAYKESVKALLDEGKKISNSDPSV
ncbi:S-layer family protein [Cohnella phaseoli]|uniref:S-layer family protein n=1 Tax=Cohnella phaseoli TaxID=456490 RepID=A0A3D9KD87_9BACL|nr:S-layer family protein [Cohnella phaseoli]